MSLCLCVGDKLADDIKYAILMGLKDKMLEEYSRIPCPNFLLNDDAGCAWAPRLCKIVVEELNDIKTDAKFKKRLSNQEKRVLNIFLEMSKESVAQNKPMELC